MAVLMQCVLTPEQLPAGMADPAGCYLETADVDANNGGGFYTWTPDKAKAMRFSSALDALAEWNRIPAALPLRPWDGRPNKPLSAFTVQIVGADS